MKPITREEMYLAKMAGQDVDTPDPVTRREMFLDAIADNGGGGGGDDISNYDLVFAPVGYANTMSDGVTFECVHGDFNAFQEKWATGVYPKVVFRLDVRTAITPILIDNQPAESGSDDPVRFYIFGAGYVNRFYSIEWKADGSTVTQGVSL